MSNQMIRAEVVMNIIAQRVKGKEEANAGREFCLRRVRAATVERSKMLEKLTLGYMMAKVNP